MKMSTKGQYALEIVADLALHSGRDHLESLKNIAERRKLSEKYLERIVKALKEKGIVKRCVQETASGVSQKSWHSLRPHPQALCHTAL